MYHCKLICKIEEIGKTWESMQEEKRIEGKRRQPIDSLETDNNVDGKNS